MVRHRRYFRRRVKALVRGAGTLVDIMPHRTHFVIGTRRHSSDNEALAADWRSVGRDLSGTMHKYGAEIDERKQLKAD
jgi:hypothetical protein